MMMKLLLTLKSNKKDQNLLLVDTVKGKTKFIPILEKDVLFSKGITYSGSDLIISFRKKGEKKDFICVFNTITKKKTIFHCTNCENINSLVSIIPGKLFADSTDTSSIECLDYDPVNHAYFEDDVHYKIGKESCPTRLTALYNYRYMWYICCGAKKRIYDLSNERVVFSNIEEPNNVFFNNQNRMCFLESGKSLFHCGDDVYHIDSDNFIRGIIEDPYDGGYWIGFVEKAGPDSGLIFIDYDGNLDNVIPLPKGIESIYNIVAARGIWSTEI